MTLILLLFTETSFASSFCSSFLIEIYLCSMPDIPLFNSILLQVISTVFSSLGLHSLYSNWNLSLSINVSFSFLSLFLFSIGFEILFFGLFHLASLHFGFDLNIFVAFCVDGGEESIVAPADDDDVEQQTTLTKSQTDTVRRRLASLRSTIQSAASRRPSSQLTLEGSSSLFRFFLCVCLKESERVWMSEVKWVSERMARILFPLAQQLFAQELYCMFIEDYNCRKMAEKNWLPFKWRPVFVIAVVHRVTLFFIFPLMKDFGCCFYRLIAWLIVGLSLINWVVASPCWSSFVPVTASMAD